MIIYKINGTDLATFGIRVSASKGLTDLPKPKPRLTTGWTDRDGQYSDDTRKNYQQRDITLTCWLAATGYLDFCEKSNAFLQLLQSQGTGDGKHLLEVILDTANPKATLYYAVTLKDAVAFDKRWNDSQMVAPFTLKLEEPEPLKTIVSNAHEPAAGTTTTAIAVQFTAVRLCKAYIACTTYDSQNGTPILPHWEYNLIGSTTLDLSRRASGTTTDDAGVVLIYGNPTDITNLQVTQDGNDITNDAVLWRTM